MGADGPDGVEGRQVPGSTDRLRTLIDRLGTGGVIGIVGVAAVVLFLVARGGSDDGSDVALTTTSMAVGPTTTVVEGPQVEPIDSCDLLPGDDVDQALGLVAEDGSFRSNGAVTFEIHETCRWEAEIDGTGESVSMELGPGSQDDFAADADIEGAAATPYPGVGDLAVWFPGDGTGTMSAVTDTANGLLFVKLTLTRSEIDDATRQELAAGLVTTAIERIRFGPPPPVEADLCEMISDDDAERLLAPHRKGRPGAMTEVFGGGSPQVADLTHSGDRSCQKLILTEIYVTAAMGSDTDFEPDAQIEGIAGQPVAGIGDQAVYFENVPGTGSFAAPHDTDILAVRSGEAMFRIVIALPDLSPDQQRDAAGHLALAALTHLPGGGGVVVPETIETPDLSKLGFVDNLLAKTDAGEWTIGEGIVATLQLFAGETTPADVLRNGDLIDDSGTEMIRLAEAYVADGPADATHTEIQRLLEVLGLPTAGANDAAPADARRSMLIASAAGPPGGARPSILMIAPRRLLQVDSGNGEDELQDSAVPGTSTPAQGENLGYAPPPEFPDDAPDLPPIDETEEIGQCNTAGGNGWKAVPAYFADGVDPLKAQVIYPESGFTPGWTETHLVWTTEAIQAALDVYNPHAAPCLHVLLTAHGGTSSYVLDTTTTGICGILLNTPMQTRAEARFKQEIARDIAHCMIPVAWPDQFDVASFTNRRWWNGALAEFLSNVVYPDPTCGNGRCDLEWRLAPALAAQELTYPMMERQDANWMFFQYLWWQGGVEGVFAVANQIPASSEPFDHERAMAGIEGMPEVFHTFVEALTDAAVDDSGGGTIAYNPPSERIPVSGEETIQRNPDPFGTKRLHLVIDPGKVACIKSTAGEDVLVTHRPGSPGGAGAGGWEPLPSEETVYTGEMTVVATTTEPGGSFTLDVTDVRDDDDCQDDEETPRDAPPVDLPCTLCAPSDYYRFMEQLAAWFQEMMRSATSGS